MLEKESGEERQSGSHGPSQVPRLQVHLKGFQKDRAGGLDPSDLLNCQRSPKEIFSGTLQTSFWTLPGLLPTLTMSTRISPGSSPSGITSQTSHPSLTTRSQKTLPTEPLHRRLET